MPLDPSISLGGTPPPQTSGLLGGNPIQALEGLAQLRNQTNQAQLFNQTFAARQRAGAIIAQSPDLDSGLTAASQDPLAMAFGGEAIKNGREIQQLLTGTQGLQATQAQTAFQGFLKTALGALDEPSQFGPLARTTLLGLPPEIAKRVAPMMESLQQSLTDGLDKLPPVDAAARLRARLGGLLLPVVTPDVMRAQTGALAPQVVQTTGPLGQAQTSVIGGPAYGAPGPGPAGGPGLGAIPRAGGSAGAPLASGPSLSDAKTMEARSGEEVKLQTHYNEAASTLPQMSNTLGLLADAMTKAQTGGGAEFKLALGKLAQTAKNLGLPITDDQVNKLANGSIADTESYMGQIKQFLTRQLAQNVAGTGRTMLPEVEAHLQAAGIETDPRAIVAHLNLAKQAMALSYEGAVGSTEFQQRLAKNDPELKGLNFLDYPRWFAAKMKREGRLNLEPIDPASVKGTEGATPATLPGGTPNNQRQFDPSTLGTFFRSPQQ